MTPSKRAPQMMSLPAPVRTRPGPVRRLTSRFAMPVISPLLLVVVTG